jgi:hypothetical protein
MATVAVPGALSGASSGTVAPVSNAWRITLSGGQRSWVMASVPEWLCLQA